MSQLLMIDKQLFKKVLVKCFKKLNASLIIYESIVNVHDLYQDDSLCPFIKHLRFKEK